MLSRMLPKAGSFVVGVWHTGVSARTFQAGISLATGVIMALGV